MYIRRRSFQIHPTTAKLLISTTMTLSTISPSSLLIHPSAAALALFQVFTVKVRQAPTSYHLVHLTNSTTLIAYIRWYTNSRFRNVLLFTSSEDPLLSYPTHCRRAAVSRTPVVSISRPTARTPSRHSSNDDVVSSHYSVQLTAYENCTIIGVSLPTSLLAVEYFGREVSMTVTSVMKCSMLILLQPLPHVPFPPSVSGFISVKSS